MTAEPHHIPGDPALVASFHAGLAPACRAIVARFQQRLFFYAKRYVGSDADAEDFTSDAFLQLWIHRKEMTTLDAIAAFLHVTVRNKCYDFLRRQQRWQDRLPLLDAPEDEAFDLAQTQIDVLDRIYAEVDRLPPRLREVFLLSYREGLKPAQIAERLQLQVQSVKNQKLTALRLIRAAIGHHGLMTFFLLWNNK